MFGGLYAGILWLIVEQHINTSKVSIQGICVPSCDQRSILKMSGSIFRNIFLFLNSGGLE